MPVPLNNKMEAAIVETSSQPNTESCAFLDLPGEIQNEIYSFIVLAGRKITIEKVVNKDTFRHDYCNKFNLQLEGYAVRWALALALTCKQIHQESLTLFYGNNKFSFWNLGELKAFFKVIGERNAKVFRNVVLRHFAETHFRFKPAEQNKAARARLVTMYRFAKKYNWRSVVLMSMFKTTQYWHFTEFDIIDLESEWANPKLDPDILKIESARMLVPSKPQGKAFVSKVEDEVGAWKNIVTKLHERY